jgi:hypothetical protein
MFALASAAAVVLIALIFLFGDRIRFQDAERRTRWMSASGGASAAFVFVVLLPKLLAGQSKLAEAGDGGVATYLRHHSFLLALAGLLIFWALDRAVIVLVAGMIESRGRAPGRRLRRSAPVWGPLLYAQAIAFGSYTMLVGYLIAKLPGRDYSLLGLFSFAMALHFLAMSHSLRQELAEAFDRFERWLLASAIASGWALAQLTEITPWVLALSNSLFAGMLIFYVVRSEIPSPKEGHFIPLLLGAVGYSTLALVLEAL